MFGLNFISKNYMALITGLVIYSIVSSYYILTNFIYIDEGMILQYAQRIIDSQIPYKDFYTQITPGTFYLNALALKIYNHAVAGRIIVFIEGFLISLMIFQILKNLKLASYSLFSLAFFAFWGTVQWNFPYYSWDSALFFVLTTMLFLIFYNETSFVKKYYISFFISLSSFLCFFFKQNLGIFLIFQNINIFIYLYLKEDKKLKTLNCFLIYLFAICALLGAFFSYFYFKDISFSEMIKLLFLNGAKNKGGIIHVLKVPLPSFTLWNLLLATFLTISNFLKLKKAETFILLTYMLYSLSLPEDAPFLYLYEIIFIYFIISIFFEIFIYPKPKKNYSLQISMILALTLMYSNTMAGSGFGRKIVSLLIAYSIFFPLLLKEIELQFISYKAKKLMYFFFGIFFLIFLTRGIELKNQNTFFQYLSPALSKQKATFQTPKLKGMTSSNTNVKIIEDTLDFIKINNIKTGELYAYYSFSVIYYLADIKNILPIDFFWSDITPAEQVMKTISEIERRKIKFILLNEAIDLEGIYRSNNYLNDELILPIMPLLNKGYKLVYQNAGIKIYQEKASYHLNKF